ncbi:hypothetical protein HJFPF1_03271 [Paramyrothecium foliicola]|nr:hypothetical protein HJFPF1_03271 [Paramyrothecium foliicola]
MADTRDFDVIKVARSDGVDSGPGYWPTATNPTGMTAAVKKTAKDAASAEKAPRTKPQMVRLAEDDPRFVEWRIKLGILLKQELSPNPEEGNPWYVKFPQGYWLYERSKHLWVSGYPIKAKLFKSPQEFGVHLIWLLSASMDYKDCCCVHCNMPNIAKLSMITDEASVSTPSEPPPKAEKTSQKVTPVPLPQIPGQPQPKSSPEVSRVQPAQAPPGPSPKPTPTPTPVPAPVPPNHQPPSVPVNYQPAPAQAIPQQQAQPLIQNQQPPQQAVHQQPRQQPQQQIQQPALSKQTTFPAQPSSQPPASNKGQAQTLTQPQPQPFPTRWSLQASLLFRVGELVWYKNGATWRLGLIAASGVGTGHEVLPIGHAMVPHQNVMKADGDMRPFYAFSVPPVTVPELKDKTFDDVSWEAMFQATANEPGKRDILALDASKMAASKIDYSHSLWSPLSEDPSGKTSTYYGCFLGAERIEVGDCVRLKALPPDLGVTADVVVFGLQFILTSKDYPGQIFFRGHVYAPAGNTPALALPEENLPIALRDESNWRTQVNPAQPWRWRLVRENVTLKDHGIRGRVYPTHRLMPILNPVAFQNAVAQRQINDLSAHLNNRMDGVSRDIGRKKNRLDILGSAVPSVARLSLEPYIREEL